MSDWLNEPDRPRMAVRRKSEEFALQKQVVQFLEYALPKDAVFFSIPNEGYRSRAAGGKLIATGMLKGCPDLCVCWRGKALFVELKSATGWLTREQRAVHRRLLLAGCEVMLARSCEQLEAMLREAGVPLRAALT